jgi:hypothetical protein
MKYQENRRRKLISSSEDYSGRDVALRRGRTQALKRMKLEIQ